jgi:hypothetical protein
MRNRRDLVKLVKDFRETEDPKTFNLILIEVDRLLLQQSYKFGGIYTFLKQVSNEDVYQTSIMSLYSAIRSVKPDDNRDRIIVRIISYLKCALKRDFRELDNLRQLLMSPGEIVDESIDDSHVTHELEMEDFKMGLYKLYEMGKIDYVQLEIMGRHVLDGEYMTDIAKDMCMTYFTTLRKYYRLLKTIREHMPRDKYY